MAVWAVGVLALGVSATAMGQMAPMNHGPAPTGDPAVEVRGSYERLKPNVIKAAEKMPADQYGYKPTPEIRSFARVVNHVTEAQFHTCTTLNGGTFDPKSVPGDDAGKDAVLAGLKASFAECDKAYAALTSANVTEALTAGQGKRSRIGMAWGNVSHDNEQYAELSTYLRLKNLVPPTGEK